jgi:hypothetical protein
MNPKIIVLIGFIGLSLGLIAVAIALPASPQYFEIPKMLLLIAAVFADVLGFASRYYTYLLWPLLKQRKKHVIISNQSAYWLSPTGDCIVRLEGSDYIATAYINIPIYVSSSEMTDSDKLKFANQVSRLVGISKDPVRFSSELYLMNKDTYIEKLKDTINQIEDEEAALVKNNAPENQMEHVRGKLSMWRKMLDNVSNEISFELGSFVCVSAKGGKEFEAITIVQQKAKELMNGIATILGVPPNIAVGTDILKYIEPEYLIPFTTITEQITRNIQQQVM